jgi:hypothetical protein
MVILAHDEDQAIRRNRGSLMILLGRKLVPLTIMVYSARPPAHP